MTLPRFRVNFRLIDFATNQPLIFFDAWITSTIFFRHKCRAQRYLINRTDRLNSIFLYNFHRTNKWEKRLKLSTPNNHFCPWNILKVDCMVRTAEARFFAIINATVFIRLWCDRTIAWILITPCFIPFQYFRKKNLLRTTLCKETTPFICLNILILVATPRHILCNASTNARCWKSFNVSNTLLFKNTTVFPSCHWSSDMAALNNIITYFLLSASDI